MASTKQKKTREEILDRCPPDFNLARKHSEANRVKDLVRKNTKIKDLDDEELYCPCCGLPTDKAAPKFSL